MIILGQLGLTLVGTSMSSPLSVIPVSASALGQPALSLAIAPTGRKFVHLYPYLSHLHMFVLLNLLLAEILHVSQVYWNWIVF